MVSGISFLCTFDMSFPFNPAFINVGPSHRIMEYDAANAMPLNAREAMRGSPSPRKVFAIMPNDASARDSRLRVSAKERAEEVAVLIGEFRTTITVTIMASVLDGNENEGCDRGVQVQKEFCEVK
jgi:hypothetical protein